MPDSFPPQIQPLARLIKLARDEAPEFVPELETYYRDATGLDWKQRCLELAGSDAQPCTASQLVTVLRDLRTPNRIVAQAYLASLPELPQQRLADILLHTATRAENEKTNPYHDCIHANSVMIFATDAAVYEHLTIDQQVLLAIAAQAHDLGHPGMNPSRKAIYSEEKIALDQFGIDSVSGEIIDPTLNLTKNETAIIYQAILATCFQPSAAGEARRNMSDNIMAKICRLLVESDTAESVSALGRERMTNLLADEVKWSLATEADKSPMIDMLTAPASRLSFLKETNPRSPGLIKLGLEKEGAAREQELANPRFDRTLVLQLLNGERLHEEQFQQNRGAIDFKHGGLSEAGLKQFADDSDLLHHAKKHATATETTFDFVLGVIHYRRPAKKGALIPLDPKDPA